MAKAHLTQNHLKSSLSKKGLISFVFSKFAFLVFGIIITAAFFYFISAQKDMQSFDEVARTGEAVSNVIGMVSASPFRVSLTYEPNMNATLNFTENSFTVDNGKKTIKMPLYFPINTTGIVAMDRCLNITKTNITEVLECH